MTAVIWRGSTRLLKDGAPLPILSWSYSDSRGEAAEWSAELDNKNGAYSPGAASGLECNPSSRFQFEWIINGVTHLSPPLIQTEYQSIDNSKESKVIIGGTDLTELWCNEDQLMGDVDCHVALKTATQVINEIATMVGAEVEYDAGFVDWYVPMLHRVGTPLEWLRDLLEVRQGWWIHDSDGKMQIHAGGELFSSLASAHSIIEREGLKVLSYRRNNSGIKNSGVCQRVQEQHDVTPANPGPRSTGIGEFDYTFAPATQVVLDIKGWGGHAEVMQFYDADDNPISALPTGNAYAGSVPVVKARMNLIADDFVTPFEYEITIRTVPPRPELMGPYEDEFESTYTDTDDVAASGLRKFPEPFTLQTIDTQATGLDFITRKVREGLLNYAQVELGMLLDSTILPGQCVSVTCNQAGLTAHKLLVDRRNCSGTVREMVMNMECCRPR